MEGWVGEECDGLLRAYSARAFDALRTGFFFLIRSSNNDQVGDDTAVVMLMPVTGAADHFLGAANQELSKCSHCVRVSDY